MKTYAAILSLLGGLMLVSACATETEVPTEPSTDTSEPSSESADEAAKAVEFDGVSTQSTCPSWAPKCCVFLQGTCRECVGRNQPCR